MSFSSLLSDLTTFISRRSVYRALNVIPEIFQNIKEQVDDVGEQVSGIDVSGGNPLFWLSETVPVQLNDQETVQIPGDAFSYTLFSNGDGSNFFDVPQYGNPGQYLLIRKDNESGVSYNLTHAISGTPIFLPRMEIFGNMGLGGQVSEMGFMCGNPYLLLRWNYSRTGWEIIDQKGMIFTFASNDQPVPYWEVKNYEAKATNIYADGTAFLNYGYYAYRVGTLVADATHCFTITSGNEVTYYPGQRLIVYAGDYASGSTLKWVSQDGAVVEDVDGVVSEIIFDNDNTSFILLEWSGSLNLWSIIDSKDVTITYES